ncbi:MAG TPA: dihydrolipoamide acetyltransferase family protein [Chloroflexota bacterium]
MSAEIAMPALGMVMTEGTIARWLVPDGAAVEKGQPVVEIETDKLTHQIEAPAAGTLRHAAAEGAILPVEGLIARIETAEASAAAAAAEAGRATAGASAAPAAPSGPASAKMAARNAPAEPPSADPAAADAPTADGPAAAPLAAAARPSNGASGHEGSAPAASDLPPRSGDPLATFSLGWPAPSAPLAPRPSLLPGSPLAAPRLDRAVSPAARRLAQERGLDLAAVAGSGPGGRVVEADVRAALERAARPTAAPAASASPAARAEAAAPSASARVLVLARQRMAGMRKAIADRMTASLATGAQLTLSREVDAAALVAARAAGRSSFEALPYDAFIARALATALAEAPALNAVVEGDEIVTFATVNVGVAVALDGGLVAPVLRDAASRPLLELARELVELTARARAGRLTPDDLADGTVTLTNLGGQGVDVFTPILNPPQSAILGVGRIAPRPVVVAGDALAARPTVHLSLTFDHRVADGVPAAQLLERVAGLLGDQRWLMAG